MASYDLATFLDSALESYMLTRAKLLEEGRSREQMALERMRIEAAVNSDLAMQKIHEEQLRQSQEQFNRGKELVPNTYTPDPNDMIQRQDVGAAQDAADYELRKTQGQANIDATNRGLDNAEAQRAFERQQAEEAMLRSIPGFGQYSFGAMEPRYTDLYNSYMEQLDPGQVLANKLRGAAQGTLGIDEATMNALQDQFRSMDTEATNRAIRESLALASTSKEAPNEANLAMFLRQHMRRDSPGNASIYDVFKNYYPNMQNAWPSEAYNPAPLNLSQPAPIHPSMLMGGGSPAEATGYTPNMMPPAVLKNRFLDEIKKRNRVQRPYRSYQMPDTSGAR